MTEQTVVVEVKGPVAVLRLNRPQARNALSRALAAELAQAIDAAEADTSIKVIVLTGLSFFSAGADIAEMAELGVEEALRDDFCGCCDRLASATKPVVAAIEGYALGGGCELVEMADIVVSSAKARFGHPEIMLGALSGAGGTQRLGRAVGRAKAMDLVLTGRLIDGAEAERIGLVSRVVPEGSALTEALAIAETLCQRPSLALRFAKEAVHHAVSTGLDGGLRLERRLFHLAFSSDDFRQQLRAFLARV